MAREFPLFEEVVLFFEAPDSSVEQYTKAAAAVQNEFSAMASPMKRNTELPPRHHWIVFSRGQIEWKPAKNQNLSQQRQI